jgi:hypothetical protein
VLACRSSPVSPRFVRRSVSVRETSIGSRPVASWFRAIRRHLPELDITARTTVGEYDIRLVLRGPTDNLSTELTSESHPQLRGATSPRSSSPEGPWADLEREPRHRLEPHGVLSRVDARDLAKLGIGKRSFEIVTVEPSSSRARPTRSPVHHRSALQQFALAGVLHGLDNAENQIWVVDHEFRAGPDSNRSRRGQRVHLGLSQEIRFDLRNRSRSEPTRERISEVMVAFEGDASEDELRRRLDVRPGDPFDYWKIWEKAEKVRRELRSQGYLEAVVDVATTPKENGGIGVEYRIRVGPKVSFAFPGDEPDGSLKEASRTPDGRCERSSSPSTSRTWRRESSSRTDTSPRPPRSRRKEANGSSW